MKRHYLIALAAAWQFIFMVDFILPLPLGPQLSQDLGFRADQMGWLAFAYTGASLVAGLIGTMYVELWGRQRVLICGLAIFAMAQVLTATAGHVTGLLACRALSGLAGAPVSAVFMAMVIGMTPAEQRGRMMARVMTGSSLAAIIGVPLALSLTPYLDWRGVFLLMAASALGLLAMTVLMQISWLDAEPAEKGAAKSDTVKGGWAQLHLLIRSPDARWAVALQILSQFSTFLIIPSLATYLVLNVGVAPQHLPYLYGAGGMAALLCMHLSAWAMDRWLWAPPLWLGCVGVAVALTVLVAASVTPGHVLVVTFGFVLFMACNAAKNVSIATATATWAPASQRASFMSLLSTVQDIGILLASAAGAVMLQYASPSTSTLSGMPRLMQLAAVLVLLLPLLYAGRMRWGLVSFADEPVPRP